MQNKELFELLKYSSPYSIWVVTYENELLELKCPFKVKSNINAGPVREGGIYSVIQVKLTSDFIIVFIVEEFAFFNYHFDILI
jgi:hypothetical protein